MVDTVYAKCDIPGMSRETIERRIVADYNHPDKMAYWNLAAQSKRWGNG